MSKKTNAAKSSDLPEGDFKVKSVEEIRDDNGFIEYRIRWTGYGAAEDTWEGIENLQGCPQRIVQYWDRRFPPSAPVPPRYQEEQRRVESLREGLKKKRTTASKEKGKPATAGPSASRATGKPAASTSGMVPNPFFKPQQGASKKPAEGDQVTVSNKLEKPAKGVKRSSASTADKGFHLAQPLNKDGSRDELAEPVWECDECDFQRSVRGRMQDHVRGAHGPDLPCIYAKDGCTKKYKQKRLLSHGRTCKFGKRGLKEKEVKKKEENKKKAEAKQEKKTEDEEKRETDEKQDKGEKEAPRTRRYVTGRRASNATSKKTSLAMFQKIFGSCARMTLMAPKM